MRTVLAALGLLLVALTACSSSNVAGPGETCGGFIANARQVPRLADTLRVSSRRRSGRSPPHLPERPIFTGREVEPRIGWRHRPDGMLTKHPGLEA